MQKYIKELREKAEVCLGPLVTKGRKFDDPMDMLRRSQNWNAFVYSGFSLDQAQLLEINKNFDPKSCFGRVVLMVLMMEKYFPEVEIKVADVVVDALAVKMLEKIKTEENPQYRKEMAHEILMYEEPHAVISVDGHQFDPISTIMRHNIVHPKVRLYDPWQAIATAYIVNEALEKTDMVARHIDLQRAETFCPEMRVLQQNNLVVKVALEHDGIRDSCKKFVDDGLNARILYFMWAEYGYLDLFKNYPDEVIDALRKEVESQPKESS